MWKRIIFQEKNDVQPKGIWKKFFFEKRQAEWGECTLFNSYQKYLVIYKSIKKSKSFYYM